MTTRNLSNNQRTIKICNTEGCDTRHYAKGFCVKHYWRIRNKTNPRPIDPTQCLVNGCLKTHFRQTYCRMHFERLRKYGGVNLFHPKWGKGETSEERFWSRVKKDANEKGCWEWQGVKIYSGYGQLHVNCKRWLAHRYAWYLTQGRDAELNVLHSCDNPPCCNPAHLREGTQQDNMRDKVERNRSAWKRKGVCYS